MDVSIAIVGRRDRPARSRGVLDAITRSQMRRLARRGHFDQGGLAGEYAARLRGTG